MCFDTQSFHNRKGNSKEVHSSLTPLEQIFVREIKLAIHNSKEFQLTVQNALGELMGEGPAQILMMAITNDGFRSPAQFVREVELVFGRDALPIYSAILKAAKDPDWLLDMHAEPAQYEVRTGGLAPTVMGRLDQGEKERDFYLHNHHQPDDFSEEDPRY